MLSGTAHTVRVDPRRHVGATSVFHHPFSARLRPVGGVGRTQQPTCTAAVIDRQAAAAAPAPSSVADPHLVIQGTPLHEAQISPSYDAIVVGSGIGGLTAAVGLAKFGGQRVLVLESHYTAGGFTHAFRRGK